MFIFDYILSSRNIMSSELISVIMSTYNEPEDWIRKSIESILGQTLQKLEFLIVCDNPNNKELINLLEEYKNKDSRIKLILNDENIGLTKSLNKALNITVGTFIARMDSDDIAASDRLEKQLKYLKDNNLDLVGSGVVCIDEEENEIATLNNLGEQLFTLFQTITGLCHKEAKVYFQENTIECLNVILSVMSSEQIVDSLVKDLKKRRRKRNQVQ